MTRRLSFLKAHGHNLLAIKNPVALRYRIRVVLEESRHTRHFNLKEAFGTASLLMFSHKYLNQHLQYIGLHRNSEGLL